MGRSLLSGQFLSGLNRIHLQEGLGLPAQLQREGGEVLQQDSVDRGGLSPRLQLVDPGTRQDFDGDHVGVEGFQPLQKVEDQRGAEALAEGSEVEGSQDHDLRPLDL